MKISSKRSAGGCLASLLAAGAFAQAPPEPADLLADLMNTPVISASKREQAVLLSPQAIEVLGREDLQAAGVFRIQDALRLLTSVQLYEHSSLTRLALRGVAPNGNPKTVQVLVDGVPLYNAEYYAVDVDNLPVPVDAVERVELVRGPSSSLYGANAQLGVVSITTRRAQSGVRGELRAGAAEGGAFHQQAFVSWGRDGLGLTAGAAGFSVRDSGVSERMVQTGRRSQVEDALHGSQLYLRPELRWEGGSLWAFHGEARKRGNPEDIESITTGRLLVRAPWQGPDTAASELGWSQDWGPDLRSELKVHRTVQDYTVGGLQPSNPGDPISVGAWQGYLALDPDLAREDAFMHFRSREAALQVNWTPLESLHVVFGADARRMEGSRSRVLGLNEAASVSGSGAFLSLDWSRGRWVLGAGARVENETLGGSRTSPRFTATYALAPNQVLRAGFFTSTRSPQMVEQLGAPSTPSAVTVPNPELRPERAGDAELGYRGVFGDLSLDLTAFRTRLRGQINNFGTGRTLNTGGVVRPVNQYQNTTDGTDLGLEAALALVPAPHWRVGLNGAWVRYLDEATGAQADYAPREQGTLWVRRKTPAFTGSVALQYQGSFGRNYPFIPPLRERSGPTWQLQWHLAWALPRGLELGFYGLNAFREATETANFGLLNQHLVRFSRRETGLQAAWRF